MECDSQISHIEKSILESKWVSYYTHGIAKEYFGIYSTVRYRAVRELSNYGRASPDRILIPHVDKHLGH